VERGKNFFFLYHLYNWKATIAFRTCRELEKKLLEQQNFALALYMWRREGNRELVGDALNVLNLKNCT
jgi:hypothetical protein